MTRQSLAVVTLGVADLDRTRRFYQAGFGWAPVFGNDEIDFYQLNGFVFGTWLKGQLADDMCRPPGPSGSMALAHNVDKKEDVAPLIERLVAHGGALLRAGDAPVHGGFRGYVADPDGHAWEIAHNPAWPIAEDGSVTFMAG